MNKKKYVEIRQQLEICKIFGEIKRKRNTDVQGKILSLKLKLKQEKQRQKVIDIIQFQNVCQVIDGVKAKFQVEIEKLREK